MTPTLRNYPKPFNAATTIAYSLARESTVSLGLYNAAGQRIRVLVSAARQPAGEYTAAWGGVDAAERSVGSGIYFYTLQINKSGQANDFTSTRRMVILK